jgi:hypothetical protein
VVNRLKNVKKYVWLILLFTFLTSIYLGFGIINKVSAKEGTYTVTNPDGSQTVYSWDNTEIIQIEFDKWSKDMVITGKHKDGGNDVTIYRTVGFSFTKGKANKNITSYTGGKTSLQKDRGLTVEDDYKNGTVITKYTIMYNDLMSSLIEDLGYSSTQLKKGVTVYLSNIFRVGYRKNNVTTDVSNYDYKNYSNQSTGKGIVDAAPWSEESKEYLKNYYDIALNVKLNSDMLNTYKIVYVDEKDNKVLKTVIEDKDIVLKETYTHTPTKELIVGSTYTYASKYKVIYDTGQTSTNSNWPLSSGAISVKHSYNSNATLYVYYRETDYKFNVYVESVNEDGTVIEEEKIVGSYKKGEKFYYTVEASIPYKKKNYKYDKKWSYSYCASNDKNVFVENETSPNYPYFKSLPDVKKGYHLYITLHYVKGGDIIITPSPTPKPSTTPRPSPTPTPELPEIDIPIGQIIEESFTVVEATGIIRADDRGAEKFVATLGVPTTESLYGEVKATEYLLGYRLIKKVGLKRYPITVTKKYILEWDGKKKDNGEIEKLTEEVEVKQIVEVDRAYGYWEIDWLDYYMIGNAVLNNYALPNEKITIEPNYTYYQTPYITYIHSGSEESHIIEPRQVKNGLELLPDVLVGGKDKPVIPEEDFTYQAFIETDLIKVKSDFLSFNGQVVMSGEIVETEAPYIYTSYLEQCFTTTHENALYKNNQVIEAIKTNGTYGSNGVIYYIRKASVNSNYGSNIAYMINGINDVVIHTPVYCDASISSNNDSYVQLINPNLSSKQLVLDEDHTLNDMIISISNIGTHSNKQGYWFRDFSKSLREPNISYIASSNGILRNEVRFPFDVYLDTGNDMVEANDIFVKAYTWIVIGRSSPRVYLPMWVEEGDYTVEFRTVAVNGTDKLNRTEDTANTELINYVATDRINVEVSGRLYGLTLYDISDYPMWQEAFRVKKSTVLKRNTIALRGTNDVIYNSNFIYDYTVGTNNQYGKTTSRKAKFTIPLVLGSHPKFKNIGVIKPGYAFRFKVDAIGSYYNDTSYVKVTPLFYHVDKNGKNRTSVDLYYDEEINGSSRKLIKVGNALDCINLKKIKTGDAYLAIPEDEIKTTAQIRGVSFQHWYSSKLDMFSFSEIKLKAHFRTYVNSNYSNHVLSSNQTPFIQAAGITKNNIMMRKQTYYGEYYIPSKAHVVTKGYDVYDYASKYGVTYKEDFWKKDGYIVVNFDIVIIDNNGKERLSYLNGFNYLNYGHCSMWVMEGGIPTKIDYEGVEFNFKAGDFVLYHTDKSISDDYSNGGTH